MHPVHVSQHWRPASSSSIFLQCWCVCILNLDMIQTVLRPFTGRSPISIYKFKAGRTKGSCQDQWQPMTPSTYPASVPLSPHATISDLPFTRSMTYRIAFRSSIYYFKELEAWFCNVSLKYRRELISVSALPYFMKPFKLFDVSSRAKQRAVLQYHGQIRIIQVQHCFNVLKTLEKFITRHPVGSPTLYVWAIFPSMLKNVHFHVTLLY